ncbi:MAG: glycosyltransferase family 9 protein [Candidatus Aminicenantes bacterium]|nr:glycosyltransferase family 9 protein [Candidatus Aminicenantes bacterium]
MAPLIQAVKKKYSKAELTLLVPMGWKEFGESIIGVDLALEAQLKNGRWAEIFIDKYKNYWDLGLIPFVYPLIPFFYALGVKNLQSFPDPRGRRNYQVHLQRKIPDSVDHMSLMMLNLLDGSDRNHGSPYIKVDLTRLPPVLNNKKYIIIHPGAKDKPRIWPLDNYVAVASKLLAKGYHIALTGTADEIHLTRYIQDKLALSGLVMDLCGKTDLISLTAAVQKAQLVFGPDTGVLHLARTLGVPNVTIGAGPSQAKIYGPDKRLHDLNKNRYIEILPDLICRDQHTVFKYKINGVNHCKRKKCLYPDIPCMTGIDGELTIREIEKIL